MLREIRGSGGGARKKHDLDNIHAEHITSTGVAKSVFRYNPGKFRIADFVEEAVHWKQIQKRMTARGYSIETLEILAKQKVLRLKGLSNELRKEFLYDIKQVKGGTYVERLPE